MESRKIIRSTLEVLATSLRVDQAVARAFRGRTLLLAYHNVVGPRDVVVGDQSLHLSFDAFRRQLDVLQAEGMVVPLDTALGGRRDHGQRRFVITFDDAYSGAISLALPELRARGLPATVFVAPGLLGTEGFWWDTVAVDAWADPVPLGQLRGEGLRIREWAAARGLLIRDVPPTQRASTHAQLAEGLLDGSVTLGCHTWDHPNLAALDVDEVRQQLSRTLDWLRASGLPWVPWVAYPYGLASLRVGQIARDVGFVGGVRVAGGWLPLKALDCMHIPRFNVPAGLSLRGFRTTITGLRQLMGKV